MPHHASHRSNLTQESLRGGVPPLNGGSGGRNPQTLVLPTLGKSPLTNSIRLPIGLLQAIKRVSHRQQHKFNPTNPRFPIKTGHTTNNRGNNVSKFNIVATGSSSWATQIGLDQQITPL